MKVGRWKGRLGKDSSVQAGAVGPQIYSESLPFQRSRFSAALGPEPPASAAVMHPLTLERGRETSGFQYNYLRTSSLYCTK